MKEVREEIAQHFFYKKYPPSNDALAYNLRWQDIPFDGCPSSKPFYDEVDDLLSLKYPIGEPMLYVGAEDQSKPQYSYSWATKHFKHSGDEYAKAEVK